MFWFLILFLFCYELFSFLGSFMVLEECNYLIRQSLRQQTKTLLHSTALAHKGSILESLERHLDNLDLSVTIEPLGLPVSALQLVKFEFFPESMLRILSLTPVVPACRWLLRACFRRG